MFSKVKPGNVSFLSVEIMEKHIKIHKNNIYVNFNHKKHLFKIPQSIHMHSLIIQH